MEIKQLLLMKSSQVLSTIKNALQSNGYSVTGNGMWVCGTSGNGIKPFVCCHVDTVNGQSVVNEQDIIVNGDTIKLSPTSNLKCLGGDDRCGVYIILKLIESGVDCHFGAFQLQEVGGVGSRQFSSSGIQAIRDKVSAYIELDRQGVKQFVSYNPNKELNALVSNVTGFGQARGSFSDVATLSNTNGQANVNLCVGYNGQHTKNEVIHISVMQSLVGITKKLVDRLNADGKVYKQEKVEYKSSFDRYGYSNGFDRGFDYFKRDHRPNRRKSFDHIFRNPQGMASFFKKMLSKNRIKDCIYIVDNQLNDDNINYVQYSGQYTIMMYLVQLYQSGIADNQYYNMRKRSETKINYLQDLKELIIYACSLYNIDVNIVTFDGTIMDMTTDVDILHALMQSNKRYKRKNRG